MADASEWPTMQAELSRKVMDVLQARIHSHAEGKLSDGELRAVADALYDSITGLVPWDLADIFYKLRQELSR